jgi:siroheme decarboxylase
LRWASTLCAVKVPEEKLENFIQAVNANPGVTHSYRRNNEYNVWFTLNAENEQDIDDFLVRLTAQTGVTDILNMRAVRTFKIDATFKI